MSCPSGAPAGAVYAVTETADGRAPVTVFLDVLNREMRTSTLGFDETPLYRDTQYDALGRTSQVSRNYFSGASVYWTTFAYDTTGRVTEETAPSGAITQSTYDGLTTTIITKNDAGSTGREVIRTTNAQGELVRVTDDLGGTNEYRYDPFGNLLETLDAASTPNVVTMSYDVRGRKRTMDDPDMGAWSYEYNVLGELVSQTDAKSQLIEMEYDVLGRIETRTENGDPTPTWEWAYDGATMGVGKPEQIAGPGGYLRVFTYDSLGRPSTTTTTIWMESFTETPAYDANGRVSRVTYPATTVHPSGFAVDYVYTSTGHLEQVVDGEDSELVYWQADTVDADGQVTKETLGNGLETRRAFKPESGLITDIETGGPTDAGVQDLSFLFDNLGNLREREDHNRSLREAFAYDSLDRVLGAELYDTTTETNLSSKSYTYDAVGNILTKSDVQSGATYTYAQYGAGPHAVTTIGGKTFEYDANGNMVERDGDTLEWTVFNKPKTITGAAATLSFTYGPERERIQRIKTEGAITTTVKYVGSLFEKKTETGEPAEFIHYIRAGATVAIFTSRSDETEKTRYVHKDHLGSTESLTDEAGEVLGTDGALSYDPWGRRRVAATWEDATSTLIVEETPRGFTGHEHYDALGLIDMNGRVYDPEIGRFLSADPFIQFPDSTQGLNRYTYVNNNPLSYTDPDGFFFGSFFKAVAGVFKGAVKAVVGVVKKAVQNPLVQAVAQIAVASVCQACAPVAAAAFTAVNGGNLGDALFAAAVTAAGQIAFHQVGELFKDVTFPGHHLVKTVAHGVVGGAFSKLRGGSFKEGFLAASVVQFAAPAIDVIPSFEGKIVAAAVIGGTAAEAGGGKFANGAVTAAFGYLFGAVSREAASRLKLVGDATAFHQARAYLEQDPGMARLFTKLDSMAVTVHIGDFFASVAGPDFIKWNPELAVRSIFGETISPALVLGHEVGHVTLPAFVRAILRSIPAGTYTNLEEYRVITFVERPAARVLGEGLRTSHRGSHYRVNDPISRY